jgi:hypothetical protein
MAFVASAARCAGAGAAPHRFHRHCWTCCVSSCRGLIWVGAGRGLRILGWWWRLPGGAGVSAKQLSSLSLSALACRAYGAPRTSWTSTGPQVWEPRRGVTKDFQPAESGELGPMKSGATPSSVNASIRPSFRASQRLGIEQITAAQPHPDLAGLAGEQLSPTSPLKRESRTRSGQTSHRTCPSDRDGADAELGP